MSFANPAGAWALLALLAVLAIHLLQRRRRRVPVSTLFLLDPRASVSLGGRRLERLRRSHSLWLQLAAAALLAFVLMLPLRVLDDSRQKVVVVLDSSVSLSAFRDELRRVLGERIAGLARGAARTDWVLLESVPGRRPVYAGTDAASLRRALDVWEPHDGHHDVRSGLENARGLAGAGGLVIFATDHDTPVSEGIERLSVGRPVDNVGLSGIEVESADGAPQIRAVVKNHGRRPARRELRAEVDGTRTEARVVELAPGEVKVLTCAFPKGRDSVVLALEPDAFTLDDRAPVVLPRPKRVRVRLTDGDPTVRAWVESLAAVDVAEPADLVLGPRAADDTRPALAWLPATDGRATTAVAVEGRHPLVDGLSWHGLVVPASAGFEPRPTDEVLVWSGTRPLIFLRGPHRLHLSFPVAGSNAERVPALLLLLHRFVEQVRRAKVAEEHANVECGQELTIATRAGEGTLGLSPDGPAPAGGALRAPWRPGFFDVHAGGERRLRAAAHFADVREADLSQASTSHLRVAEGSEARRRHTRDDPLMPLWITLLGALLVADWGLSERRGR